MDRPGPQSTLTINLLRVERLLDVAEAFYRMEHLSATASLRELAPAERQRYIRAAELGWDFLRFGELPR